jgi:hypothetical protein
VFGDTGSIETAIGSQIPLIDTFVEAFDTKNNNQSVGKVQVLVITPWSIDTSVKVRVDKVVKGVNVTRSQDTPPPNLAIPKGQVGLTTSYGELVTMKVLDLFGKPLNPIYNGLDVQEKVGGNPQKSILVSITNGTYPDMVDWYATQAQGAKIVAQPNKEPGKTQIKNWLTKDKPLAYQGGKSVQDFKPLFIYIAGHELKVFRTISAEPVKGDKFKANFKIVDQ